MTFSKRLSGLMTQRGVSASSLAEAVGKSRQSVNYWMSGRNEPSAETLAQIAEFLETSALWLKTGEVAGPQSDILRPQGNSAPDGYVRVPVFDVSAGCGSRPAPADDIVSGYLDVASWFLRGLPGVVTTAHINVVPSSGDSMEPTIASTALCLVDRSQNEIRREGIYCLRADDVLLIKRVQRNLDGTITLLSDNPRYPPQCVSPDVLERTVIIGRVIYTFNGLSL